MGQRLRAVVAGGSGGIGRACCVAIADLVDSVVVLSRDPTAAASKETLEIVRGSGTEAEAAACDLSDPSGVRQVFRDASARGDFRIAIAVNASGVGQGGFAMLTTPAQWCRTITTNLSGAFYFAKEAMRTMAREGGVIVNVSSIAGSISAGGQPAYSASKAGLDSLTRTLAQEGGRFGVRVNGVAPGFTQTKMIHGVSQRALEWYLERTALKRVAEPSEVAAAVRFLASNESSYVTGQTLLVDGGYA